MRQHGLLKRIAGILLCICLLPLNVFAETTVGDSDNGVFKYYCEQLTTDDAREIYGILETMSANGHLRTGDVSVSLTYLNPVSREALMADFSAARDAFMLDYADLFYVDFDKLSVTFDGQNYSMGIGRDTTYLRDGFTDEEAVTSAVTAFESAVASIVNSVDRTASLRDQVRTAYNAVMEKTTYALEADAKDENVLYVRTPYGTLVKGESVCEGYARALKTVLDELGIKNVLAQGMFVDTDTERKEPHMWNYVCMDDNRWYLVDATMGDGSNGNSAYADNYFLVPGMSETFSDYQPDGVISLSSTSFEFSYPMLSPYSYAELSDVFTWEAATETQLDKDNEPYELQIKKTQYNDQSFGKAATEGNYILCSFDGKNWYYYDLYMIAVAEATVNLYLKDYDKEEYSVIYDFIGFAYLAVTEDIPPAEWENYGKYNGSNIYDQYKIGEVTEYKKVAPTVVTSLPATSRLEGGEQYTAVLTYNESLRLANTAETASVKFVTEIEGATILPDSFRWEGNTVTFTFTTVDTYAYTTAYYFELVNLVGAETRLKPNPAGFHVVNTPSFSCPKIPNGINTIYSNTPALIADDNLDTSDWEVNGNPVGPNLPSRLALVASTVSDTEAEKMEEAVQKELGSEPLASQTYDLSLTLCSGQVSYISGKPVRVFVPFPEGYNASTPGVTFKAYHWTGTEMEEIDCVTTEKGIILMCKAFSPYTIAAVKTDETTPIVKNVSLITTGGRGDFLDAANSESTSLVFLKLNEGQTEQLRVVPGEGYRINSIRINGRFVDIKNNGEETLTLTYENLTANSVIEAEFVSVNTIVCSKGDVNADGIVDRDDALYLYNHLTDSAKYPMDRYFGSLNFDSSEDSLSDIEDVKYLFGNTVLPLLYPLP